MVMTTSIASFTDRDALNTSQTANGTFSRYHRETQSKPIPVLDAPKPLLPVLRTQSRGEPTASWAKPTISRPDAIGTSIAGKSDCES
jgi:hypothetical protein